MADEIQVSDVVQAPNTGDTDSEIRDNGGAQQLEVTDNPQGEQQSQQQQAPEQTNEQQQTTDSELTQAYNKSLEGQTALKEDAEKRGLDFNSYYEEYMNSGELSEKSYKAIEKAGYPKQVVDGFIAGQLAAENALAERVIQNAGGNENFKALTEFAKSKGQATVEAWNNVINSGNLEVINLMVKGMQADYTAQYGSKNPTIMGSGTSAPASVQGYETVAEMVKAMSDPRYRVDKKYTQEVFNKTNKSNLFK